MIKKYMTILAVAVQIFHISTATAYQQIDSILKDSVFDLEHFVYSLNSKDQHNSLESTLAALKAAEPHFFNHYVLMYKSRSLQTSSFMYPRVLLSSPNSTTVVSYNGNSLDHGYEKLEVMRFDPKKARFKFNEIEFKNGKLKISSDNPQKCMRCHQNSSRVQNDPRPNWEPYSIWPGAYSSLSVGGTELSNPRSRKYDLVLAHDSELENEMYQKFLDEIVPTHARYQLLKPMQKSSLGRYFPAIGVPDEAPNRFTTTITTHFLNANVLRIVRLMRDTPIFEEYKKTIYALARCDHLYMPEPIFNWHREAANSTLGEKPSLEEFAKALELIFHPYGISTQDWSMDFGTGGRFAFRHRFGGPNSFRTSLAAALKKSLPELRSHTCNELKSEILQQDFSKTQTLRDQVALDLKTKIKTPLLSRCVSCHTNFSFGAPFIPFDDEVKLKSALSLNGYPRGSLKQEIFYRVGTHAQFFERMPADGYLPTANEIEVLKSYLNTL